MAARFKVIVLEKDPGAPHYTYVLWADVPTARQALYAAAWGPTRVSAWKDATNGAGSDNEKLQNGSVVETQQSIDVPVGWTLAQIEAEVQIRWTAYQNKITTANPWIRYGTTWDGTTWILTGVA